MSLPEAKTMTEQPMIAVQQLLIDRMIERISAQDETLKQILEAINNLEKCFSLSEHNYRVVVGDVIELKKDQKEQNAQIQSLQRITDRLETLLKVVTWVFAAIGAAVIVYVAENLLKLI